MLYGDLITLGEWTPDQPSYQNGCNEALNVIPGIKSYQKFQGYAASSMTPLTARCQGAGSFTAPNGDIAQYAGDDAKLYYNDAGDWTDASKVGGYTTDTAAAWRFAAFGSIAIAVNGTDAPQKITISGGTTFADLGGSPPVARDIAIVKDYVFLGGLASDLTAVQWCATNDAESWPVGSGGGDKQPIPDTGEVERVFGGDFALVLTQRGIHRFDFVGGDIGFQRRQVSFGVGATIPGSVAGYNQRVFFCHRTGFHMCMNGDVPINIGSERVNNWFWSNVDQGNLHRVSAKVDPENNTYVLSFPDQSNTNGDINHLLIFKWTVGEAGRWSHVQLPDPLDILYTIITAQVYTMEDLDVYGTMEDVPYSLDSAFWVGVGRLILGAFGTDHNSGAFNGDTLTAVVETIETTLAPGSRSKLRSFRPMVEGDGTTTAQIGGRNELNAITYGDPLSAGSAGLIKAHRNSNFKFHRVRLTVSGDFDHIMGVSEIEFYPTGQR